MDYNNANMSLSVEKFDYTMHGENSGHEWKSWVRSFEYCMNASGIEDEQKKLNMLLHFAGKKVQDIYAELPEAKSQQARGPLISGYIPHTTPYEEALAKLNEFFLPQQHATYERYVLRSMEPEKGESIAVYGMRLKIQAERCNFGDNLEDHVKDQIIEKCRSATLRREMLKQGDASLQVILTTAKVFESIAKQEKVFANKEPSPAPTMTTEVNKINVQDRVMKRKRTNDDNRIECFRCGYTGHRANDGDCPAMGKTCNKCGGRNHFGAKCKTKRRMQMKFGYHSLKPNDVYNENKAPTAKRPQTSEAAIQYVRDTTFGEHEGYIFCILPNDAGNEIKCIIGQVETTAVVDSGSTYNLIDRDTWKQLKAMKVLVSNQRNKSDREFKAYGGRQLKVSGMVEAKVAVGDKEVTADFYVMEEEGKLLLGRVTATALGVLKIGTDVYKIDCDENIEKPIGKIKDVLIDIPLREDVTPVIQPYRQIAVPLEKVVEKKIDDLLKQDIIEKVNGPSNWISPMVAIPKDDGKDIRICIDMRRANQAVQRENYPLPTMENFLPYIGKGKWFGKLDVKQAFHQVEISEKSREITTFITRKGLCRYKRLMFGITCAPEIFQKIMEQILSGCEGCLNYIDDVLLYGKDEKELKQRTEKVLKILKERDVTLNNDKCVYGVKEIEFLGHRLNGNGLKPTEDKVTAVKQFRKPNTAEEVRSFLGLVTYVGKFIPNLATITEPLRLLTKKSEVFKWNDPQQQAFEKLKQLITSDMLLGYYDVDDRTQLYADASPVGLGAVLIQHDRHGPRIISYASKSLSDVKKRYCQTEKEALALVGAVEKFHYYLFGREFELVTDHKPLEVIFGPKSRPCARIERWVLRLQSYQYKIVYQSGKSNIADPLSRLLDETRSYNTFDEQSEHYVNWIANLATPKALKLDEIVEASKKDATIISLKNAIFKNEWSDELKLFKLFKTELCFADDILLRGTRMIMPETLRERTIQLAHEGHPGMTVMKRRLRAKVWWPKMDQQVESFVKSCHGCTLVSAPSPPEPMKRKDLPSQPWQHLAIDFLGPLPSGHSLLVVVDYYSRFIEIEIMKKIDSAETIKRLRAIFARFGTPLTITADNGRQLISDEFKAFCDENNIKLISTIPYWPQQNGEAERQNRSILKRLVISQQMKADWTADLQNYLHMYRSTPHSTTLKTPAEMIFGWNIRDKIPTIYHPLEIDEETSDRDKEKKEKEREYADNKRNAKEINIQEGDEVLVKQVVKTNKLAPTFEPTVHRVIKRKGGEVTIESQETKKVYRRNVAHLKKINDEQSTEPRSKRQLRQPLRYMQ